MKKISILLEREREREREYHNGDPISYKPHKGLNGFENKSTL